jgi:hypothetical protein
LNTAEYAIVSGSVSDVTQSETPLSVEGMQVSLQTYNPSTADEKDKVDVFTATLTDANGNFKIFAEPGAYTLVGFADTGSGNPGYTIVFRKTTLAASAVVTSDLTVTETAVGSIAGSVSLPDGGTDDHVTLSIRETVNFGSGPDEQIEVRSLYIADGGSYTVNLQAGEYIVVASSYGFTTKVYNATVTAGSETTVDISL